MGWKSMTSPLAPLLQGEGNELRLEILQNDFLYDTNQSVKIFVCSKCSVLLLQEKE